MGSIQLIPISADSESPFTAIHINFNRIKDELNTALVEGNSVSVTGSLIVTTDINLIKSAVASLASIPSASACFVQCDITGSNEITIYVYDDTFTLSAVAVDVNWMAIGE